MFFKPGKGSPTTLAFVVAVHVLLLGALLQFQPKNSPASAEIMHVSLITLPMPSPTIQSPAPPEPRAQPRKVERTITPPPLEAPSETAISAPPAPEPEPIVASAPPAPPEPPAPIVLPRFDVDYLQNPPPAYPALSRRTGEQGKVLLRVVVRPDGSPETVELRRSSGFERLDDAALEAVRRWRFVPARQGHTPVTAAVIVPIVFALES